MFFVLHHVEDDIAINPKEFPDVKIGDILEIYHPDEEESRYVVHSGFVYTIQCTVSSLCVSFNV